VGEGGIETEKRRNGETGKWRRIETVKNGRIETGILNCSKI
jgi:hypothetical protein